MLLPVEVQHAGCRHSDHATSSSQQKPQQQRGQSDGSTAQHTSMLGFSFPSGGVTSVISLEGDTFKQLVLPGLQQDAASLLLAGMAGGWLVQVRWRMRAAVHVMPCTRLDAAPWPCTPMLAGAQCVAHTTRCCRARCALQVTATCVRVLDGGNGWQLAHTWTPPRGATIALAATAAAAAGSEMALACGSLLLCLRISRCDGAISVAGTTELQQQASALGLLRLSGGAQRACAVQARAML